MRTDLRRRNPRNRVALIQPETSCRFYSQAKGRVHVIRSSEIPIHPPAEAAIRFATHRTLIFVEIFSSARTDDNSRSREAADAFLPVGARDEAAHDRPFGDDFAIMNAAGTGAIIAGTAHDEGAGTYGHLYIADLQDLLPHRTFERGDRIEAERNVSREIIETAGLVRPVIPNGVERIGRAWIGLLLDRCLRKMVRRHEGPGMRDRLGLVRPVAKFFSFHDFLRLN